LVAAEGRRGEIFSDRTISRLWLSRPFQAALQAIRNIIARSGTKLLLAIPLACLMQPHHAHTGGRCNRAKSCNQGESLMFTQHLSLRYFFGIMALNLAIGVVCLAQQTSPNKQTIQARMVADWTRARDYTKEYLDAIPEDGLNFKPTPEIRSFAEQMLHLANANFNFISAATDISNPYDKKNLEKISEYSANKGALTKVVLESYDFALSALAKLDETKLQENIKLFGRFELTRAAVFDKAFEHQTHQRGQTTIYLRLKGVKPPSEKLF